MIMTYIHDTLWSQHWLRKLWFLCIIPSWELSHILYQPALLKMMIFLSRLTSARSLEGTPWKNWHGTWKSPVGKGNSSEPNLHLWLQAVDFPWNCTVAAIPKKKDTIPFLKKSLKNLKDGFTTPIDNYPKSQVPFQMIVPIPIRITLSCDSFVTGIFLSSRSWHWLFHNLEVLSWQLWFQPFRPLTLYKKHLLHPGKLSFSTQKWRFASYDFHFQLGDF